MIEHAPFLMAAAGPKVNSLLILLASGVWLYLGYRWWSRVIDRKLIEPRGDARMPSEELRDGVDFEPARPSVLFGHHFSSIAGAGPIVGPVFACALFGWGPTLLWVLIGSVFFGAVHDYTALMISVRNKGKSIPEVARNAVGPEARVLFLVFVWVTLIFVITAFAGLTRDTFIARPEIVLPTFGIVGLAIVFGIAVYRLKWNLHLSTVLAVLGLLGLLYLGCKIPVTLSELPAGETGGPAGRYWATVQLGFSQAFAQKAWFGLLLIYGLVASVLPVWFLLQPRDYLSSWLLLLGIVLGVGGIVVLGFGGVETMSGELQGSPFKSFRSAKGPLWPMLFIIVACGAISGFHSIVSGGTSAKQLANERHGRAIGFGSMVVEGLLAVIALLAVAAGLKAAAFGDIMKPGGGGAMVAFARGFGAMTAPFLKSFGVLIGMILVNAFLMTTLDTSVRLTRFIQTELLADRWPVMKNRWLGSLVPVIAALLLSVTGGFKVIWPLFGASNQLLAALTLIAVTAYLFARGKPRAYTLIPAIFMVCTTIAALGYQMYGFTVPPDPRPEDWAIKWPLAVTCGCLIVLAVAVLALAWRSLTSGSAGQRNVDSEKETIQVG